MLTDVITILLAMSKNTPTKEACKNPMVNPPTRLDTRELKWLLKNYRDCHWLHVTLVFLRILDHVDINSMRRLQSWENFCRFLSGSSTMAMNATTGFVALTGLLMAKKGDTGMQLIPFRIHNSTDQQQICEGACWLS